MENSSYEALQRTIAIGIENHLFCKSNKNGDEINGDLNIKMQLTFKKRILTICEVRNGIKHNLGFDKGKYC